MTSRSAESSPVKCNKRNSPVVVFAHGSGRRSTSEWMIRWRNLLAKALNAVEVVTFDYPYIHGKMKPETLVGYHSDIVRKVAAKYPEHPLILAGKSMGSRISCMVAAEKDIEASAVVCLGYSLGETSNICFFLRLLATFFYCIATYGGILDEPLLQLTVPIMFIQGGNDSICPLKSLEVIRNKLKAVNTLHIIEHGDHSFQIAKKNLELTGMTHEKAEECAVEAIAMFVSQVTSGALINGTRNMTGLPIRSYPERVPARHVSRMEAPVEDVAAGEQNSQPQPKVENFNIAKKPTQNMRKRKSERIVKNKLKKSVYDKDGRGSTIDKPVQIDD
ncbi:hypothetical protein SSX86_004987 [Deinandra increscens subsp. villosa]|uniref:KANL3/Tex30 alpha/beta hydrolase-like domain-containing protein n=1 Tax=Deinandra increscens subsp. villosa TaxID=3103831 RepID=A0AAP0DP61_9ASTR